MQYKIDSELNLVQVRKRYIGLIAWFLLLIAVILAVLFIPKETVLYKYIHYPSASAPTPKDVPLTEQGLTEALHRHGCVLPNIAVAQAKLESQLGKSNVGKQAKNLFGIVWHKCEYVTGKFGVFATYKTYEDNIKCYIHVQDHYLKRIDGVYAEPGYSDLLRKMK